MNKNWGEKSKEPHTVETQIPLSKGGLSRPLLEEGGRGFFILGGELV